MNEVPAVPPIFGNLNWTKFTCRKPRNWSELKFIYGRKVPVPSCDDAEIQQHKLIHQILYLIACMEKRFSIFLLSNCVCAKMTKPITGRSAASPGWKHQHYATLVLSSWPATPLTVTGALAFSVTPEKDYKEGPDYETLISVLTTSALFTVMELI